MNVSSVIDSVVAAFSPSSAIKRQISRSALSNISKRSSQYAAAKTNRMTGSWSPVDSNVNTIIGNSASAVRARVRQLVRDFPYFARAVKILTDYTVGEGIIYQARVQNANGDLDNKTNTLIEDAFNFWADEADVAGKLHYYEMMALAKRQDIESGEFLLIKVTSRARNSYIPFALQIYETDWLTDVGTKASNKYNEITQGIEYHIQSGAVVAYHFSDPDGWGKTIRVKAENVIHGFDTQRPGQLRGISSLTPCVMVAHDLGAYMDAEIDAAKMAAKYLAFVKTGDPYTRQFGRVETDSDSDQQIEEMENAIIEYLAPGEDIQVASNPRPGSNFPPFVKLILTMMSVTTGVPYELLSGDYGGMNYSTSRTVRNDFNQQLRPIIKRHVRHFAQPTFKTFLDYAVLSNKISLPGYASNPWHYQKCEWQPPGMESIDPLRETKARIDEVKNGFSLETVYREIARAKTMADELGLDFKETKTALANNPQAVGEEKEKEPKGKKWAI